MRLSRLLTYSTVFAGAILICIPLWWMVTTSIKPSANVFTFPPELIPSKVRWQNYSDIFLLLPFVHYFKNTMVIVLFTLVGGTLSSAIVGYGFAKLRFPGSSVLFMVMLSTMMIPYHTLIIPHFILFKNFGWLNTYLPLIVPAFFGSPFYVFLFRQFFKSISKEYNDAARIDGCGYFGTFLRVIVPMSMPVFGVVAIYTFNGVWNDFLGPLIYINSESKRTIQLAINALKGLHTVEWHLLMAASVCALIPSVLIFFFLQRRMIQGIVVSGIKG